MVRSHHMERGVDKWVLTLFFTYFFWIIIMASIFFQDWPKKNIFWVFMAMGAVPWGALGGYVFFFLPIKIVFADLSFHNCSLFTHDQGFWEVYVLEKTIPKTRADEMKYNKRSLWHMASQWWLPEMTANWPIKKGVASVNHALTSKVCLPSMSLVLSRKHLVSTS